MSGIAWQLRIIGFCKKAFWGLIVLLFGLISYAMWTLSSHQKLAEHSTHVIGKLKTLEAKYTSADFEGRNRIVTGMDSPRLFALRQSVFVELTELKTTVSDNETQMQNLDNLNEAIENRFKTQDEQFATASKNGDTVTYKLDSIVKSLQFTETVDNLLSQIEINEYNYLQLNRMPMLMNTLWQMCYFGVGLVLLFIVAISTFEYFYRKLLERSETIGDQMQEWAENLEAENQFKQDAINFGKFIKQEIDNLPQSLTDKSINP